MPPRRGTTTIAKASLSAATPPATEDTEARETVAAYVERWLAERDARELSSVRDDRGRLAVHVLPLLGPKPIAAVSRSDIEDLVEALDLKVRDGDIAWLTAGHIWRTVSKLFSDAQSAKVRALRVREDNPCAGVRGPDRGVTKAKAYLYPSEFVTLASCNAVPLAWRRLFALAVYLYVRAGELEELRWEDVDLERGILHIHRAIDRSRGRVKATKSSSARRFTVEPAILPLLRAMRAESPDAVKLIAKMPDIAKLAKTLRRFLQDVGVDRAELFADDATRKHMTFHDLRATGITWMAVRGDDPLKIKSRAGHASFSTTEGYIRAAEQVRDGFGTVFPPLPPALLGQADRLDEAATSIEPTPVEPDPPRPSSSDASPPGSPTPSSLELASAPLVVFRPSPPAAPAPARAPAANRPGIVRESSGQRFAGPNPQGFRAPPARIGRATFGLGTRRIQHDKHA